MTGQETRPVDWASVLKDDAFVRVAGCDMDGIPRGKTMAKSKFLKVLQSGFGFCDVVFGWDCQDKVYAPTQQQLATFADLLAVPDLGTFRRIPWEGDMPFFLIDFVDPSTGSLLAVSPRGLLTRVLVASKDRTGLGALCGMEYEFYNFKGVLSS